MHEIATFLREHPPFDTLAEADVERLAATAEIQFFAKGDAILVQGAPPVEHFWIVRTGSVELLDHGRVLDLVAPGEPFGHGSMLSGLPPGLAARAHEDTLTYRLPAAAATPLLARPEALPFVARSLLARAHASARPELAADPLDRSAGDLIRSTLVLCLPGDTVRAAAQRMTEAGASAAVIDTGGPEVGILTDRDFRTKVVAGDVPVDAPVSDVMTERAYVVSPGRPGTEVLIEMLARGVRHMPVRAASGEVLGVVDDTDLIAAETHTPFQLRRAIDRASSADGLARAARALRPTIVALHDARVDPERIGAIVAVVADALTWRLIELDLEQHGNPGASFDWVVLGSLARREGVLSSDIDSALVWRDAEGDPQANEDAMVAMGGRVMQGLAACGFDACPQGAVASNPLFARSQERWRQALTSWFDDPTQEKALVLVSLVVDGRPLTGDADTPALGDVLRSARDRPRLLRLVARFALSHRPPTGFLRDIVVEHSGEHRGRLDIKRGGILPITDLARWAGLAAGVGSASTRERLRAAAAAGTLPAADARTLEEAFDLLFGLRLEHQVEQLRAGTPPDDHIDPGQLNRLTRGYLKEAFRAIASVQKGVSSQLGLRQR